MLANNGKGNTPLRDVWQTPQPLFNELNHQYKFGFDCCASEENTKCRKFSSNFETETLPPINPDLLENVCWMNPPFSIAYKLFELFVMNVYKGVAIYRCDNLETGIWQRVILPNVDWVFIPNKRVSYDGLDGDKARFPSALIGIGVEPPKNLKGIILTVIK